MARALDICFINLLIMCIVISTTDATLGDIIITRKAKDTTLSDIIITRKTETEEFTTVSSADKDEEDCDCGPNSISCRFVSKTKNCTCEDGYAQIKKYYPNEETCKKCDCGPNSVSCQFDGSGIKECTCKVGYAETYRYDPNKTCKECDCGNGSCSFFRREKTCECNDKFEELDGKCTECDCGPNSLHCYFSNGKKKCKCESGYSVLKAFNDETCQKCDCGPHTLPCEFVKGIKICKCKPGYAVSSDNKVCEECDCGDGECEFEYGIKTCRCNGKLVDVNGKCEECDCGPNSISCKLDSMNSRRCTCKNGYAPSKMFSFGDESCTECDCGTYGTSCSFRTNGLNPIQSCDCSYGVNLRTQDGKCKECDCGPNGYSCFFNSDIKRRCTCNNNYKANKAYSWEDQYCKLVITEWSGEGPSGWIIGTYIIGAIFSVIIIGLLIAIVTKNMNGIRRR